MSGHACQHINGRVFKHQVHIQCSYKGPRGQTVVNKGNKILLKQTPQRAVNNQETQNTTESLPGRTSASCALPPSGGNFGQQGYRDRNMTHPPGQCIRKLTDVNFVSGGITVMQGNHIESNTKHNSGPKGKLERIYRDNILIGAEIHSKCFKYLRSSLYIILLEDFLGK